ncbi:ATP synthase F1 subunit gamma [Acetohalobium arabaticum]|uniref:ATP synthase gamma chain n=1 Tax=Acetohalobium arabaticum (strain ATCC 49924 / DSM 5501 / Z-7288) TaxID=574087 RepID=D9QTY2_ACEAZ|nr:ATP synthase F1 subunit gamma [Acetohalobium arabaticum]ADL13703.1 ATP synthase F1, gamma subunit [Acetohalobium arabaticum DSM 5501]
MATMREIQRRINSVENTKKITRAMNMVASAKLQRAQESATAAKPFFEKTRQTLLGAFRRIREDVHPLLEKRDQMNRIGYIVITADRGLCGPYNTNVTRKVDEEVEDKSEVGMIAVGRNGRNHFKRNDLEIFSEYLDLEDKPSIGLAQNISNEASELYQDEVFDEVHLIYTQFNSVLSHEVKKLQLLPVEPQKIEDKDEEEGEELNAGYLYEPSPGEVLDVILPKYLRNLIYGSLLEAKASEFAARMTAMDSATENAKEMIEDLTRSFNRARQAEITQEITEIAAGAEALD